MIMREASIMKKIILVVLLLFIITGCNNKKFDVAIYTRPPIESKVYDKEVLVQQETTIYYKGEYAKKLIFKETMKFNSIDKNFLENYSKMTRETFSNDVFNYEGFGYKDNIYEGTFEYMVTLDYQKMDMKNLSEIKDGFTAAAEIVTDDYQVSYSKLNDLIVAQGLEKNK